MDDLSTLPQNVTRRYGFAVMIDSSTPRPQQIQPLVELALRAYFTDDNFDVVLVNHKDIEE